MLDARLMLDGHAEYKVLAGAVDECTDTSYDLLNRFHVYAAGVTAGEGATFFLLSQQAQHDSLARISAFDMFTTPDETQAAQQVAAFLQRHDLKPAVSDLLLNGDTVTLASAPVATLFSGNEVLDFKKYCGEYPTASAFALALAVQKIKEGRDRCWILNRLGRHWSIWCIDKIKPAAH